MQLVEADWLKESWKKKHRQTGTAQIKRIAPAYAYIIVNR